ncbi:phage tail protein [Thalassotalea sp. 1_MG-2023]|uniref:phage tail-collar fiber domain-containing protein n=1 Tax=Thalassotalea sp. 1_MG-2023 TaxID=3062680 RepID=UPI0026E24F03|nr:phage tail protein [Thalassotalea sp. 1_MG-2023]MDO6426243.1 phage tail protein [Thalassotalea sp. 1_MG-2023]
MSTLLITNAGLSYKDAVFAGSEVQNITHFVFANVNGLQETDPIDPNATVPTADVVHTQPVEMVSQLNDNAVVISCAMGYNVGTFDFNWYGVIATKADNSEVLIAVVHTNSQTKTKTVGANAGDYSVKSIVWRSNSIAAQLNVSLSALPWQASHEEFVSKAEFDAHNHDDDNEPFYVTEDETAITTKDKLHVFMDFADLQIPTDSGKAFDFVIDQSVTLSELNKCRLLAPTGKKIIMNETPYDSINIKVKNVRYTAYKNSNGDYKI